MTGLLVTTVAYFGSALLAGVLWIAEVAQHGLDDRSWIAPCIVAVGGVLIGLAGKAPAIIAAIKAEPKRPRASRRKTTD